jgi:hypothetical protein
MMYSKLLQACRSVEACKFAVQNPHDNLPELIQALQTSVDSYLATKKVNQALVASSSPSYVVDETFYRGSNQRFFDNRKKSFSNRSNRFKSTSSLTKQRGWIYKEIGHFSPQHTQEEQNNQRREYKAMQEKAGFNRGNPNFRKESREQYYQFLIEFEGVPEEEKPEYSSETEGDKPTQTHQFH